MRPLHAFLTAALAVLPVFGVVFHAESAPVPEIRDGERVLFLGDTLLERENTSGLLETALQERFRDRHFTVRNLSWSGDTPAGLSRAMFDPPAKGWERLKEQIALVKPTTVFLGYGMAASLQELTDRSGDITLNPDPTRYGRDPMTPSRFKRELHELMDSINQAATAWSADLAPGIGNTKGVSFVFLSPIRHEDLRTSRPGLPDPTPHNQLIVQYSKVIEDLATESSMPFVSLAGLEANGVVTSNGIHLSEEGYRQLAPWVLRELGWSTEPTALRADLRQAVLHKDELFFHRTRPENWTYLFGFRQHEQGKNAVEIPAFDPLIAAADQEIDRLKNSAPAAPAQPEAKASAPAHAEAPAPSEFPKFDVEKGFQIDLWAANPLLEKPVEMNWDSEGRLWIASSNTYPQVNPQDMASSIAADLAKSGKSGPSAGNDKIIILEDPDHSGKATKSTVFADGLLIPTGVAPFRNSQGHWACYVGASTELVELTDTTGAGKADRRRVILSGFGTEDTHHIVHTLRWSPDGRLYFNQSIYIHSHFETPWGMVRLNSGGVLSWDPRTERVEVAFKGFCNPWGHAWDEWGQEFITDGAGFEGVTWGIPGAMNFSYENGRKIIDSISPGTYPKFASLEIVRTPLFPEDWQGSFITNDFRAHRIVHFGVNDLSIDPDSAKARSGYITKEMPDLVRTSDLSFRPIDVKLGPDGALYVADWSNPVINHGEVDFRDPRRDHYSGRIWRIALKDKTPLAWEKMTQKSAKELIPSLGSGNAWEQAQARRVLAELGQDKAATPLLAWWSTLSETQSLGSPQKIWMENALSSLGLTSPIQKSFGQSLMADADPHVRAFAPRNLDPHDSTSLSTLNLLSADPNPRVRVATMRQLAEIPTGRSAELALNAAMKAPEGDNLYAYAAWLTINDLAEPWTQSLADGSWKVEGRERQLEFALGAIDPALASSALAKVLAKREIPVDGGPWIDLIGKAGGPAELGKLFDAIVTSKLNATAAEKALAALREAARLRNARPAGELAKIELLLENANSKLAAGAARLIGLWKLPALDVLAKAAQKAPEEVRLAAIDGLHELGGDGAATSLVGLTNAEQPIAIRRAALVALTQTDVAAGVSATGAVLPAISDPNAALETWRALFQIKGAPAKFAAKPPTNLPPAIAAAAVRAAHELGKNGNDLAAAFASQAGAMPDAAKPAANYDSIVTAVRRDGDPARGEMIFRRPQLACLTCHAIGGAGGKVGPELTSLGASAPLDYIIESVLVPNAKVKEGYNAMSLTLKDGTVAAGIQARETAQEIFLRNAAGQETSVPKANIVNRENIGSIMPAGLVDTLPDRERLDLYAFLSQLGKPGVYDASKGNVARAWMLYPAGAAATGAVAANYSGPSASGNTLVDGRLTRELLQADLPLLGVSEEKAAAVAKFQLPSSGAITMNVAGVSAAWIDGQSAALQTQPDKSATFAATLSAGEHTLCVVFDAKNLPDSVRAECADVRFIGN